MTSDPALRVLVQACHEALDDARAGGTWLADMVDQLQRLCRALEEADIEPPR